MTIHALIFDIGGSVFDWQTAIVEALAKAVPAERLADVDAKKFSYDVRDRFLKLNMAVVRGESTWMTSDAMFASVMHGALAGFGLASLADDRFDILAKAWRNMPAWPGAREGIAALRRNYIAAPLTILSWSMAVGSSRRNGIEWDSILSCDVLGIYKPDPRIYTRAAEIIDCRVGQLMMVAVHPSDLRAAKAAGYRTAYVLPQLEDPGEDYTDSGFADEFDVTAKDFLDLAQRLG